MEQADSERSFIANEADESVIIDYPQRQSTSGEGETDDFLSVDELQACGIGAVDIQKLKLAGICTIKVIINSETNCFSGLFCRVFI